MLILKHRMPYQLSAGFSHPSSSAHYGNNANKAKAMQLSKYDNHSYSYIIVLVKEVFYTTKHLH